MIKNRIVSSLALIWLMLTTLLSCAVSGNCTAAGDGKCATGNATLNINVPVVTFGDKVAEAATKGIDAYLQTINGPLTAAVKANAVREGVEAGLKEANAEGKTVTKANEIELQEKVKETVEKKAQLRGK